jgi:hypothetical protein
LWDGAADITEPRGSDEAVAIPDVMLAYKETLVVAAASTVYDQHRRTLALDGIFDVSELLCGHDVASAQQVLTVGLHACTKAWIGNRHENNQPEHQKNGQ